MSKIRFEIEKLITTEQGVRVLTLTLVEPPSFSSPTSRQEVDRYSVRFLPEPDRRQEGFDDRGNHLMTAVWEYPPPVVVARVTFELVNSTILTEITTNAPFPVKSTAGETAVYLEPTRLVQADDPSIRERSDALTRGSRTQFEAVHRVISWVMENMSYVSPSPRCDARYSLECGRGNCQNYSHLCAALLRASGIPVRIVNGITLKKPFHVRGKENSLTFRMGQGRHSWIEVWFPDLGWVPFDPYRTVMFVANRFVRVEVGSDNSETVQDGRVRWTTEKNSGARSRSQETISAEFPVDMVALDGTDERIGPGSLLLCPPVGTVHEHVECEEMPVTVCAVPAMHSQPRSSFSSLRSGCDLSRTAHIGDSAAGVIDLGDGWFEEVRSGGDAAFSPSFLSICP